MPRYETSDALTRAAADFREHYLPHISADDTIAQREAWNVHTDSLCKDGEISDYEYDRCPAWDDVRSGPIQIEAEPDLSELFEGTGCTLESTPLDSRPGAMGAYNGPRHRRPLHFAVKIAKGNRIVWEGHWTCGAGHLRSFPAFGRVTVAQEAAMERERKTFRPSVEDVLGSLLRDASIDPEMTFREWLDEGTAPENAADALDCYNALRETRSAMRDAFGEDFKDALALAADL